MTTTDLTLDVDPDASCDCGNCDWEGSVDKVMPIQDIGQRINPGCTVPVGECPECGALAYLVRQ